MAEKQNHKERLKEITDSIETGINELFESDKYMQYLRTMSRFHSYSLNNTLLISMQKPDATLVAGFNKWRDQFTRNVKKGERGIKIIAPTPYKIKKEQDKLDPVTKAPILDAGGKVMTEEVEVKIPLYKVVSVFDVSQTEGKPLPQLADNLTGDVKQFEVFMEALKRSAPVPIAFEKMAEDTDGYFSSKEQRIAIREGMSEVQTVSAEIHEIAHSKLHNYEKEKQETVKTDETAPPIKPKDRRTEEVEAESISFAVCTYYGIKTDANSFGYIAAWSKDKELPELRSSLETINKTASSLIKDIDRNFAEHTKEKGIDLPPEHLASPVDEPTLSILPQETYINNDSQNISIEGHIGTWYVIDSTEIKGTEYFLLEHEEHGDEAASVIVTAGGELVLDDVWNGFGDLEEHFESLEPVPYPEKSHLLEPPAEEHSYPLPDHDVSIADRNAYGYLDDVMLPLSQERAAELFEQDLTVYLLYEDDTEAMAFDREDIDNHSGIFGIERNDWIALQDFEALKDKEKFSISELEQRFLDSSADAFAIYQLKGGEDLRDYRFEGLERLQGVGLSVEHDHYELVYSAPLNDFNGNQNHTLNKLYGQFNIDHPTDFRGHSLSVSDIVALKVGSEVSSYYVDSFGFTEQPQFLPARNYLETAEKSTEQNFNQIDGVLNNQPTVAEPPQTVKAGGQISLLDLANAVNAEKKEKRTSVVEQLKTKPSAEKEKTKKAPYMGAGMER